MSAVYIILFPLLATCVIGTGGAPPQLLGKLFSVAWGKIIHEKPEAKNIVTLSL